MTKPTAHTLCAAAAFALLAVAVAVSCADNGSLAERAARAEDAVPARVALALVRTAAALCLAAAASILAGPRLRRPATAFLLLAMAVGPLYLFAVTPFSVPDETFHYAQVLARAAPLAGRTELPAAAADTFRPADTPTKGNALLYLPQTLGAAAGLRAGRGPRGVFYAGRAAALAFYVLCAFFAIRLAPAFRRSFAVVALCPIALQQAASHSYDCAALGAAFLGGAFFLRLAAGGEGRLPRNAGAAALAATAAGMAAKGAAAPFLPLLAAVPTARFRGGRRGRAAFLAFALAIAAAALAAAHSILPGVVRDLPPGSLPGGAATHAPLDLLADPAGLARILLRTFDFDAIQLAFDAVGSRLSGLTLKLPTHVTLAFMGAVLLSPRGDRALPRARRLRAAAAAGVLLLTAFLCFVMLVKDTPARAGNVWNLQGRYWTPVLPLVLLAAFAREGRPAPRPPRTAGLLFAALALLHLDAIVFLVKRTVGA